MDHFLFIFKERYCIEWLEKSLQHVQLLPTHAHRLFPFFFDHLVNWLIDWTCITKKGLLVITFYIKHGPFLVLQWLFKKKKVFIEPSNCVLVVITKDVIKSSQTFFFLIVDLYVTVHPVGRKEITWNLIFQFLIWVFKSNIRDLL